MRQVASVDELVERAMVASGRDQMGQHAWRDGLSVLVDSANTEADLNRLKAHVQKEGA